MARLAIRQIAKRFGAKPVLSGVDLNVGAGSLVAVLGSSGSGKTTLLRLICGFERADAGEVVVDGEIVSGDGVHAPPEKRRIGYVAQEGSLFPHLSVFDNVGFGLARSKRRDRARIDALLSSVGLPSAYADRAPHQLSGGEQQRVALARALAPAPKLVLLDEPFSSLDAALRVETRQAVANALAASGATALLVTHDQSEALAMGSEVAVLRGGVVAQIATPETLYREPVDAAMARFVGEAVVLPGIVKAGSATCALGRLRLASPVPDGPADVMVRPEQIRFTAPSAEVQRARVIDIAFYGQDATVRLALDASRETIASRVPGYRAPKPGEDVHVSVEGAAMAYPRTISDAASRGADPLGALISANPVSLAALGIEEKLS
jgi:iron(III) transport system ATP-binding protein